MQYPDLNAFLARQRRALRRGPVAMVFAEDDVALEVTIRHHRNLGFACVLVLGAEGWRPPPDLDQRIFHIAADVTAQGVVSDHVTRVAQAATGQWMYYCFNAEFLFYPFCESRSVSELMAFHAEERRDAMLTYVVDLYAGDLDICPDGVSLDDAWLDAVGYHALARPDPENHNYPKERQLNFYGGLRWRFEEHVPEDRRRIDRIALFKAAKGVRMRSDHTFSDEEYNTYACPWHNNLTATIASFRTAKALKRNPGSTYDIRDFRWRNAAPFTWHSQQFLDLGLMEPGQWF